MRLPFHLMNRISFKKRLFAYSFLLSIIPVLLLGMISSHIAVQSIQEEVNVNHQNALNEMRNHVDLYLKELDLTSIRIANDLTIEKSLRLGISMDDTEKLQTMLDMMDVLTTYRSYSDINLNLSLVYNKDGVVYSNNYGLVKFQEYPYYELLRTIKLQYTGSIVIPPNTYPNQKRLLIIRSISTSAIDGMLVMEVDANKLFSYFQTIDLGNNSKVMVIDNDKRIIVSRDPADIGTRLPSSPYLNKDFNMSIRQSAINQWTYVILTPSEELSRKAENIKHATWLIAGCLALIWILLAAIGSHRLYVPIQRLTLKLPGMIIGSNKDGLKALDQYMDRVMETNKLLENQLMQQMPYVHENLLLQLLRGEITEADFIKKKEQYGLLLHGKTIYVCVFEINRFEQNYHGKDRSLMMYALSKAVQELCEACMYSSATVIPRLGQLALIIGISTEVKQTDPMVTDTISLFRSKVKEYFKVSIHVAVSRAYKSYHQVSEGYREALNLLRYRMLLRDDIILTPDIVDKPSHFQQPGKLMVKWEKTIVKSISDGDICLANSQFTEMLEAIQQHVTDYETIVGFFIHLLGEIDNLFAEMDSELSQCFEYNIYSRLYSMSTLEELKHWFCQEFFSSIQQHLKGLNVSTKRKRMQQVLEYIHNHFETDLSLQQVADHFHLSTFQVSRMFKEEMNANFMDYLIHYRMDKAKQWLVHTDMPIKEITDRLRYTTTQNFSRVFKQTTGLPPGKYREDYRQRDVVAEPLNYQP